jgi:hypothetical protein
VISDQWLVISAVKTLEHWAEAKHVDLLTTDHWLLTTAKKTGSRNSPTEANRGDVHLDRIWVREKSCPEMSRGKDLQLKAWV